MAKPSSAYLLIAAGEDVAMSRNTRFSKSFTIHITALHYIYFQL